MHEERDRETFICQIDWWVARKAHVARAVQLMHQRTPLRVKELIAIKNINATKFFNRDGIIVITKTQLLAQEHVIRRI